MNNITGRYRETELFLKDYRLTTIKVYYYMPDYVSLLQEFVLQQYDIAPQYPELNKFLLHWHKNIDAVIKEVLMSQGSLMKDFKKVDNYIVSGSLH